MILVTSKIVILLKFANKQILGKCTLKVGGQKRSLLDLPSWQEAVKEAYLHDRRLLRRPTFMTGGYKL